MVLSGDRKSGAKSASEVRRTSFLQTMQSPIVNCSCGKVTMKLWKAAFIPYPFLNDGSQRVPREAFLFIL
eukprot:4532203-Amphidinium_carterae.1